MIPAAIVPLIRRAILDLLNDIGGEQNDDVLAMLLAQLGHRIARRDVADQLRWLAEQKLIASEELGPFIVARILVDGRDIAEGRLVVEGVWRHKTGD
ncbi:hypothetical protein [Novosphingobium sp. EMRT-2]|uniref:VpaChn25_0724 family phage protein n=1 Tax=Novosphingobium sp. EMRT-2 TaxID=2571749 RepID=UPI0010BDD70F|nr:hypothetical protein [Novosphingobium sp. EMRT-2]QCI93241.1 hypothetical protein FA702_06530 [Novosphingobium sp. EMRT-2]